ncbi:MAG: hypothetical protein Q9170_003150 [Blastenia crenularia]
MAPSSDRSTTGHDPPLELSVRNTVVQDNSPSSELTGYDSGYICYSLKTLGDHKERMNGFDGHIQHLYYEFEQMRRRLDKLPPGRRGFGDEDICPRFQRVCDDTRAAIRRIDQDRNDDRNEKDQHFSDCLERYKRIELATIDLRAGWAKTTRSNEQRFNENERELRRVRADVRNIEQRREEQTFYTAQLGPIPTDYLELIVHVERLQSLLKDTDRRLQIPEEWIGPTTGDHTNLQQLSREEFIQVLRALPPNIQQGISTQLGRLDRREASRHAGWYRD